MALQDPKYPVPNTVSPEAQAMLGNPIDMSGFYQTKPGTVEEWEKVIQAANAPYEPFVDQVIAGAPLRVKKDEIAGVTVRHLQPDTVHEDRKNHLLINLHGGGYAMLGGELSAMEGISLAVAGGFNVVSVDYRMPPRHPFPAAVDDGVAVYKALLEQYPAGNIGIFGSSAGGGLTAAVCIAARDQGLPLPAAVILNTPWCDLEKNGDSYFTNDGVDPILSSYDTGLGAMAKIYAGEQDMKHPLISPIHADFSPGFPPSMLVTGTRDLLLSCTVRLHRALRSANIQADLHVFEAMWHGFGSVPEGRIADQESVAFLEKHFGLGSAT